MKRLPALLVAIALSGIVSAQSRAPIADAAQAKDTAAVRKLIKEGGDVNAAQGGQRSLSAEVSQNAQAGSGGVVDAANQKLAEQYASLFRVFLKHHKNIQLVTFWGVTDRDSWRHSGKPLLFDGEWRPKPAFDAVIAEAKLLKGEARTDP